MRDKLPRTVVALLGVLAALVWSALFLANPRVSLELLVLFAPVVTPIWLITMLTRSRDHRRGRDGAAPVSPATGAPHAAVLARDSGRCNQCGGGAARVVARRPSRAGEADPLARFVSLCDACASATPLMGRPVASGQ